MSKIILTISIKVDDNLQTVEFIESIETILNKVKEIKVIEDADLSYFQTHELASFQDGDYSGLDGTYDRNGIKKPVEKLQWNH